jgi:hypothetical protein
MDILKPKQQFQEYKKNQIFLSQILKKKPIEFKFMSHPCGSYNEETLKILKKLGVKMGFRHNLEKKSNKNFEIARINHSNLLNKI